MTSPAGLCAPRSHGFPGLASILRVAHRCPGDGSSRLDAGCTTRGLPQLQLLGMCPGSEGLADLELLQRCPVPEHLMGLNLVRMCVDQLSHGGGGVISPILETQGTCGTVVVRPRTVCVTGASGFIGSWLVLELLAAGHHVVGTVRNAKDPDRVQHLWTMPGASERLKLLEANLKDWGSFDAAIRGESVDVVMHTAAPFSVPQVAVVCFSGNDWGWAAAGCWGGLQVGCGTQTCTHCGQDGKVQ